jgi:hypothetical protein
MTFAALICSGEFACPFRAGGKARINGFSASPSSTVGNAGGNVLVGVTLPGVSVCVAVAVGSVRRMPGKLQFTNTNMTMGMNIISEEILRFTADYLRL